MGDIIYSAHLNFGIAGVLFSTCHFLSPLLTLKRILKNKSVEEFKSDPYLASTISCIFWILHSHPSISAHNYHVLIANCVGFALGTFSLVIFFIYSNKNQRRWILSFSVVGVVIAVGVGVAAFKVFHNHTSRSTWVGCFSVFFGIIQYASPLTIMRNVIKNKSVKYMPLFLSVTSFFSGIIWTVYSCLLFDVYLCVANGAGILLGGVQLVLYGYYSRKKPKALDGQSPKPVA